jgi:hypothetical protein
VAGSKTFETLFKIGAVFTGAAAFNQAQAAIKKTEHAGVLAGLSLKKMVVGLGAFALGYKGLTGATDFIKESIASARDAQDAYDKLYTSLQRVPQLQKLGVTVTKEQADKLRELSEQMQRTGGISAKSLEIGFAGLSKSFSPRQIYNMSAGFQDLIVKFKGLKPSADDVADITGKIGYAIKNNVGTQLMRAKILSADQAKEFKHLGSEAKRTEYLFKLLSKQTGETARQFETSKGVQERYRLAVERIQDAIGSPFVKTQDAFARSLGKVADAIGPIAEKLSAKVTPIFQNFADNLGKNTPQIVAAIDKIANAFNWILEHWQQIIHAVTAIGIAFLAFKSLQGVVSTINGIAAAMKALQTVLSAGQLFAMLASPTGLIIAGLIALAAAIYLVITHWKEVKKWALDTWKAIQTAWGQFVPWFKSKVIIPFLQATKGIWQPLVEPVKKLWTEIGPLLDQLVHYIIASFATLPGSLRWIWNNVVVATYNRLKDLVTVVAPIAQRAFQNWLSVVSWVSQYVIAPIVNAFADIIGKIKAGDLWGAFRVWVDTVSQIRQNVIDKIVELFNNLGPAITTALGGVGSAILGAFSGPLATVKSWIDGIGTAWNTMIAGLKQPALPTATTPPPAMAPGLGVIQKQSGGLVAHPSLSALAERGIPEMVIPLQGTSRSRGLLSQTAEAIGIGGLRQGVGRTGGPISVSLNAPITINGAAAGQEATLGREIQRALQDPIRNLLEQLRRAKDEEARLAYA